MTQLIITLKISQNKGESTSRKIGHFFIDFNGIIEQKGDIIEFFMNKIYIGVLNCKTNKFELLPDYTGSSYFYSYNKTSFYFSNKIDYHFKDGNKKEENKSVLAEFLTYGYILPPQTIYKNIFRMQIFETLIIQISSNLNIKHEYNFNKKKHFKSQKESIKINSLILENYLEKEIPFDKQKKYTLLFSGGLDSSILCVLLKKAGVVFNMVSTGFEFNKADLLEKEYSLTASELLNKQTQYESFDFTKLINNLPEIIEINQEPICHIQTLLLYGLIKNKKEIFYSNVINGQGADSIFGTEAQYLYFNSPKEPLNKSAIPYYSFLPSEYQINKNLNRNNLAKRYPKLDPLDLNFVLDIEGATSQTANCWFNCFVMNKYNISYPLFNPTLINLVSKLEWKYRLKERKYILRSLGRKNNIPEIIISRAKGSFGPISNEWHQYLTYLLPICSRYFNLDGKLLENKDRYVLWNLVNYSIWRLLNIENISVGEILGYMKKHEVKQSR
jgi:asparagine synthetase B (glutamine-hydrolysing)